MKLVDTCVWIDFFRGSPGGVAVADLVREGLALLHPWVLGELAAGNLGPRRRLILADFALFPMAPVVPHDEQLAFLEHHALHGIGLGWVDVQLLAASRLASAELLTTDRRLVQAVRRLEVGRG